MSQERKAPQVRFMVNVNAKYREVLKQLSVDLTTARQQPTTMVLALQIALEEAAAKYSKKVGK